MRIDKYLKITRLIKRRTIATNACSIGRVSVNDVVVKPSYNVKIGDIIKIQFGEKIVAVEVIMIKDTSKKEEAENLFRYLEVQ